MSEGVEFVRGCCVGGGVNAGGGGGGTSQARMSRARPRLAYSMPESLGMPVNPLGSLRPLPITLETLSDIKELLC